MELLDATWSGNDKPFIVASWRPIDHSVAENSALIGAKAKGLFNLPNTWVPPFLVLTTAFTTRYSEEHNAQRLLSLLPAEQQELWSHFTDAIVPANGRRVIARSNSASEDIELRGAYESYHIDDPTKDSISVLERILGHYACCPKEMAVILQVMITPSWGGHMSNERHVTRTPGSWLIEGLRADHSVQHRITAGIAAPNGPLWAKSNQGVESALRSVATILKNRLPLRFHCEWVWDGRRVWIVQADEVTSKIDSSFTDQYFSIKNRGKVSFTPQLLQIFSAVSDRARWPKLARPNLFYSLSLPTTAIYFLRGDQWANSETQGLLADDLNSMCALPVVVRCDVADVDAMDETLLPTSAPLTSVFEILSFLSDTAEVFKHRGIPESNWAFLFAHLVPAQASAMVLARPKAERIQVDALWGFPDGLLYFRHDTCFVYTGNKPLKYFIRYKGQCLLPHDGQWQTETLGPPRDWNPVLSSTEAKTLAAWAGTIANAVGHEIQLMALVRIGGERGPAACLPFHYTDWSIPSYTQSVASVPNRSELGVLRNFDDIKAFRESRNVATAYVIRPRADMLRSKEFLREAAALCAGEGKPVYFEGSLLAHAYYIMRKAGATVIPVTQEKPREERKRYRKLVRDNIPVIIQNAGGVAHVRHVARSLAMLLLKQKLIEESFEVRETDARNLVDELADVLEVIDAIRDYGNIDPKQLDTVRRERRESRGGFEHLVFLEETGIRSLQENDDTGIIPLFSDFETEIYTTPSASIEVLPNTSTSDLLRFEVSLIPPVDSLANNSLHSHSGEFDVQIKYDGARAQVSVQKPRQSVSSAQLSLFTHTVAAR